MSVVEASRLSGLSRQWWLDAEKGERRDSNRGVVTTVLRPENLAKATQAVGGDVAAMFALAGLDPTPFLSGPTQPEDVDVVRLRAQVEPFPPRQSVPHPTSRRVQDTGSFPSRSSP